MTSKGLEALRQIGCCEIQENDKDIEIKDYLPHFYKTIEKELEAYKDLKQKVKEWHDLLLKSGVDSKGQVVYEIEHYLEEHNDNR